MTVLGAVPARARITFVKHFRLAMDRGWSWRAARSIAKPMAQNAHYREDRAPIAMGIAA